MSALKLRTYQLAPFLFEGKMLILEFAHGHVAPCILIIAEAQYKDASVVDKEINIMAMFVNLLGELTRVNG